MMMKFLCLMKKTGMYIIQKRKKTGLNVLKQWSPTGWSSNIVCHARGKLTFATELKTNSLIGQLGGTDQIQMNANQDTIAQLLPTCPIQQHMISA